MSDLGEGIRYLSGWQSRAHGSSDRCFYRRSHTSLFQNLQGYLITQNKLDEIVSKRAARKVTSPVPSRSNLPRKWIRGKETVQFRKRLSFTVSSNRRFTKITRKGRRKIWTIILRIGPPFTQIADWMKSAENTQRIDVISKNSGKAVTSPDKYFFKGKDDK